jgi:hypothetical protein
VLLAVTLEPGTERRQNRGRFTHTEDLAFAKGDLPQLYIKNSDAGFLPNTKLLHPSARLPARQTRGCHKDGAGSGKPLCKDWVENQ